MDFQKLVEGANDRLRGRRCSCRIELRKKAFVLRATLPSKDGNKHKQQRVAIDLPATATGLADAEFQALRLDSDLRSGNFCWSDWSKEEFKPRRENQMGSAITARRRLWLRAANAQEARHPH